MCVCAVQRLAVRNLQLSDVTTYSMRVSWDPLGPNVRHYRVSYISTRGDRAEQTVRSEPSHTRVDLQIFDSYRNIHIANCADLKEFTSKTKIDM